MLTLTSNHRAHSGPRKTTRVSQTRLGSWVGRCRLGTLRKNVEPLGGDSAGWPFEYLW